MIAHKSAGGQDRVSAGKGAGSRVLTIVHREYDTGSRFPCFCAAPHLGLAAAVSEQNVRNLVVQCAFEQGVETGGASSCTDPRGAGIEETVADSPVRETQAGALSMDFDAERFQQTERIRSAVRFRGGRRYDPHPPAGFRQHLTGGSFGYSRAASGIHWRLWDEQQQTSIVHSWPLCNYMWWSGLPAGNDGFRAGMSFLLRKTCPLESGHRRSWGMSA